MRFSSRIVLANENATKFRLIGTPVIERQSRQANTLP